MQQIPYERILDSLSEGVCTVDCDLVVTYFNTAAEQITAFAASEVVGASVSTVFEPTKCRCLEVLRRVLERGDTVRNEAVSIQCRRTKPVPIRLNVSRLRQDDDACVGAVMTFRDVSDVETLRRELKCEYCTSDIVTKSHKMKAILDVVPQVAQSDSPVLILGQSGTGKELLARAIHSSGDRSEGPFIAVNCGALPDNLLESELFGYKAGAFTDAKKDKPGRFALAENGTLFLDEIGDISPAMQVKLLRVLQEKVYEPLGAIQSQKTNARIIAATNRDLKTQVADGSFRSDLYYRVNVVEFRLPSLAERREDIPLLVEHFIEKRNAEVGKSIYGISQGALNRLMMHAFPGNIRELENIVERAYVMCPFDTIQEGCLQLDEMPPGREPTCRLDRAEQTLAAARTIVGAAGIDAHAVADASLRDRLDARRKELTPDEERAVIVEALEANNGHRRRTADALGVDPSTLWRKMRKHGIGG